MHAGGFAVKGQPTVQKDLHIESLKTKRIYTAPCKSSNQAERAWYRFQDFAIYRRRFIQIFFARQRLLFHGKKKNCYTRALLCAARQRAKHFPTMRRLEKLFQLDSKTIVLDLSAPQSGAEPQVLCGEEQPTGARRFAYWEPLDKTRTHSTVQELKRGRTSIAPVVHLQLSDKTLLLTADNLSETSSLSMVFFCMAKRSKELVRKSCDSCTPVHCATCKNKARPAGINQGSLSILALQANSLGAGWFVIRTLKSGPPVIQESMGCVSGYQKKLISVVAPATKPC